jgi:hypothetical protein
MPRKVFTAGEVLAAADVNSFLMDQAVQTFDSAAARGSAIGTATEGMVTWLNDENALQVYDGTAWNGLAASGGNAIINGAFEINQRNFTSSTAGGYGFDRWFTSVTGGTVTYSSQAFTAGTAPQAGYEAANFARVVTAGQSAAADVAIFRQLIEDVRTFANQTVTISFWAKAGSSTPKIALDTTQSFGAGGSSSVTNLAGQVTLSTSWTRYSVTTAIPSIAGQTIGTSSNLGINFFLSAGSTFNARTGSLGIQNNTFDIWGVQVEAGPTANVFRRNANSLQGELAACQRYYQRSSSPSGTNFAKYGTGFYTSTIASQVLYVFNTTMRVAPTSIETSNLGLYDGVGINAITASSLGDATPNAATIVHNVASLGTAGKVIQSIANNSSAAFVGFSAEL